jgi:hypothetical protein
MSFVPPPIPSVPLVGPDRVVSREWWRWFHDVFTAIGPLIPPSPPGPPVPPATAAAGMFVQDPPLDPSQATLLTLSRLTAGDPTPDTAQAALLVLRLLRPEDPAPDPAQGVMAGFAFALPADEVNGEQTAFLSQMMSVPA